jgi:hypothetical protein
MKLLVSLLLLSVFGGFTSCELFSNNDEPKTELEKLPPITQEGKNTFGCLVNGRALVTTNTMQITAIYQGGGVQLSGGDEGKDYDKDIKIVLNDPLVEGEIYLLTNPPSYRAQYRDEVSTGICLYEYGDTYEGHLIFLKIDKTKYIISGTFEFSTVTQGCDTIRITNGRFDVQYIP